VARKSQFERLVNDLINSSWWLSPVVGAVFYVGLKYGAPHILGNKPIFAGILIVTQKMAPYSFLFFCVVGLIAFLNAKRKAGLVDRHAGEASFSGLSWKEFEELVGEVYRRKGYRVTENYTAGPDGGVDLRIRKDGERIIVQCKRWNRWKVGVKVIRELYGIMAAEEIEKGIVVISSEFTDEARRFAQANGIELVDGNRLSRFIRELKRDSELIPVDPVELFPREKKGPNEPKCPNCGGEMVLRTAKSGKYAGKQFYGCRNYPKCKGIVQA
jgi:restriction system protein